jgi:hypothetical protein
MRSLGVSCIASSPLLLFRIGGEPFHQTPWVHDLLQERSKSSGFAHAPNPYSRFAPFEKSILDSLPGMQAALRYVEQAICRFLFNVQRHGTAAGSCAALALSASRHSADVPGDLVERPQKPKTHP